jgi:hypothetical protein
MRLVNLCGCAALGLVAVTALFRSATMIGTPQAREVSGTLIFDGKTIPLEHASVDETDEAEPIVVLSDKALPPEAVPFLPEKLVKEKAVHAVAFSVSRKDKTLTNTFGKVYGPGHESGVGLGRVEDGGIKLVIRRLDGSVIEGTITTVKPVVLSYVSYSFDLTFRAPAGKKKR